MFEQGARHPARDLVDSKCVNPTAFLLASAKMLGHLKLNNYAKAIQDSVYEVIAEGKIWTPDIGGKHNMNEFTDAVFSKVKLA